MKSTQNAGKVHTTDHTTVYTTTVHAWSLSRFDVTILILLM